MAFTLRRIDLHKPTAQWYSDYLQGTKWREFRERLILQRGPLCEVCNERDHFSLHHKTYARLFNELEEDVILVCKECHERCHREDNIPLLPWIYNSNLNEILVKLQRTNAAPIVTTPTKR